ncbi:AbrB family transcriptional regulator, partial [Enterococcus faecalis]
MGATRSVASVPAVYQFLSVKQKSKVIFVPRSFFIFFFHQKK